MWYSFVLSPRIASSSATMGKNRKNKANWRGFAVPAAQEGGTADRTNQDEVTAASDSPCAHSESSGSLKRSSTHDVDDENDGGQKIEGGRPVKKQKKPPRADSSRYPTISFSEKARL